MYKAILIPKLLMDWGSPFLFPTTSLSYSPAYTILPLCRLLTQYQIQYILFYFYIILLIIIKAKAHQRGRHAQTTVAMARPRHAPVSKKPYHSNLKHVNVQSKHQQSNLGFEAVSHFDTWVWFEARELWYAWAYEIELILNPKWSTRTFFFWWMINFH